MRAESPSDGFARACPGVIAESLVLLAQACTLLLISPVEGFYAI